MSVQFYRECQTEMFILDSTPSLTPTLLLNSILLCICIRKEATMWKKYSSVQIMFGHSSKLNILFTLKHISILYIPPPPPQVFYLIVV